MGALNGLTILVPESRELDLFAGMLETEGATALRCPMVQILDLDDKREAEAWIDAMIARPFDDVILLTGEGLRRLVDVSGARRDGFIAALGKSRLVTRGPKPARALREIGLAPSLAAPVPTSQGVLQALSQDLSGRRIGVQLYPGDGPLPLLAELKARGAEVYAVTPYRYASEAQSAEVAAMIKRMAAGEIGMIAFTASPQLDRLFSVAREQGLGAALSAGLARTKIAAIGPVMESALAARGLASAIHPQSSFHLKPLVKAIVQAWEAPCA